MKPIYILHDGSFIFYDGPRETLRMIGLPTLIPGLVRPGSTVAFPPVLTDDPATSSLYEHPSIDADIIAARPPTPADWQNLAQSLARAKSRAERNNRRAREGP